MQTVQSERTHRAGSSYWPAQATAYACTTCGATSTDAEARTAGRAIVQDDHGRYVHQETAEIVTPGIPVDDIDNDCCDATCGEAYACTDDDETSHRNPVTIVGESIDWIPVRGGSAAPGSATCRSGPAAQSACRGCGTPTRQGWYCNACNERLMALEAHC